MHKDEMKTHLMNILSSDQNQRSLAEQKILEFQNANFSTFLDVLLEIHCEESDELHPYKITAGILMKNSLHSNDKALQNSIEEKWIMIDQSLRGKIKNRLIQNISTSKLKIALLSANALATIGRIEIYRGSFKELYQVMQTFINSNNQILMRAALECIGLLCTYMIVETSYDFTNDSDTIYDLITCKLEKSQEQIIKTGAIKCLIFSLETIEASISEEGKMLNLLGKVAAMCDGDEELTAYSIEALYKIMGLYHEKMAGCFDQLIGFIMTLFSVDSELVTIQIIEFWCVLAEIEIETQGRIIEKNCAPILQYLLSKLYKNEFQNEEGWNSHKAATACIETISKCVTTSFLNFQFYREFIEKNFSSEDLAKQEVGTIALGCHLNKQQPNQKEFFEKFIPKVVSNIKITELKSASLWTLSKITEHNFSFIDPGEVLPELIANTSEVISENSSFSVYGAYLFAGMCAYVANERNEGLEYENLLSFFFYDILDVLLRATESMDLKNYKLRSALFQALIEFVNASSERVNLVLDNLLRYSINKVSTYLQHQNNVDYFLILEDLISLYVVLMQNIVSIRKEENIKTMKNEILELFIGILNCSPTFIYSDVYISLSILCKPSSFFTSNIGTFIPYITRDLRSFDFYVVKAAVNLIGDIANTLKYGFLVYSDKIVPELIQCLVSTNISRDIKPIVLSVFGDVSLSLGQSFLPYLEMTFQIIQQTMTLDRKFDETFVDEVRKSSLQMLNCVIIALRYQPLINENLDNLATLIRGIIHEDVNRYCKKECITLISDIVEIYGKDNKFGERWVGEYLEKMKNGEKDFKLKFFTENTLNVWKGG